ncbi:GNAT family N-acetyltransferase [Staphylococcus simulans]|uniref:GNAT family N-acetyltransferase n=1 Tax=Staphylococcus simulans TaxID=1286 RepID=UPI00399A158C
MNIRPEQPNNYIAVEQLVKAAFENVEMSDQTEHHLVQRIRQSDAYIPELSLVAQINKGEIIGHVLLSKITIGSHTPSLALAPLSVAPEAQGKGIGTELVEAALEAAQEQGYHSVVVLGDPAYYQRFGFLLASDYHIYGPMQEMEPYLMIKPLKATILDETRGMVHYSKAFGL